MNNLNILISITVLAPLVGSIIAGLFGQLIGRVNAHRITILGVAIAFATSAIIFKQVVLGGASFNHDVYTFAAGPAFNFKIGFLVDRLTAALLITVTFVSLLVHIYTIGYMADDAGYQRFFSYISLFTFAMLMLVSANNFLQLFFGWEGVGLVSYLLIGFWYTRESANQGALKAFLVNRVGDFGFLLGIALIYAYAGSIDYQIVFAKVQTLVSTHISIYPHSSWSLISLICILLFVGAMGKSAQMPLHVWLPESMEGPTPISALIHAATMVTAGVFMVARMSPLFEYSLPARSLIMVIGATGALFTGLIAIVQTDIKRVIAYSTLSQLGYMMVAQGASAYSIGIFHLMTHACFKALLFLGAGSVIIALHHEQDMRKMGGLWKYMPITYITFLIGTLALVALPPFAGFFSKDMIIDAAKASVIPGASYAYYCVLAGAFVTALYSFRALFLTFHTNERFDAHTREHLHESPWVVWLPLVLLAIPSILLGAVMIKPMLFDPQTILGNSIFVLPQNNVVATLAEEFHGVWAMMRQSIFSLPFWMVISGTAVAWIFYIAAPGLPDIVAKRFSLLYRILVNKLGFDSFNDRVFVTGTRDVAEGLYRYSDRRVIDGFFVNGTGALVQWASARVRLSQSGYLYHYATVMVVGLLVFLFWIVLG